MASSVTAMPPASAASSARRSCRRRNSCGVSARHRRSRGSVPSIPPSSPARLSVSRTGAARMAPTGSMRPRPSSASRSEGCRLGRAASCTSTKSSGRTASGSACRPASTDAARVAPPAVRSSGLPYSMGSGNTGASCAPSTSTMPAIPACPASAATVCASRLIPPTSWNCLGTSPPKRMPRPAAGTTTQALMAPASAAARRDRAHARPVAARCAHRRRRGRKSRPA